MAHFVLIYQLSDDYLERRGPLRAEHIGLARTFEEAGQIVLGGAFADPADSAMMIFEAETDAPARAFVEADPYVAHGLVTSWQIRPWTTVLGERAASPIPPGGAVA